jgi:hypothetical protein
MKMETLQEEENCCIIMWYCSLESERYEDILVVIFIENIV